MKTEPIDKNRCQEFLENVKNEGRKATFHRAFDCTRDPYEAIETLIDLGFDRLLTSGQEATAEEGIHLLADLQEKIMGTRSRSSQDVESTKTTPRRS